MVSLLWWLALLPDARRDTAYGRRALDGRLFEDDRANFWVPLIGFCDFGAFGFFFGLRLFVALKLLRESVWQRMRNFGSIRTQPLHSEVRRAFMFLGPADGLLVVFYIGFGALLLRSVAPRHRTTVEGRTMLRDGMSRRDEMR